MSKASFLHGWDAWICNKYRDKAEIKTHKKTTLLWNNPRKEDKKIFTTRIVFLSFFSAIVCK